MSVLENLQLAGVSEVPPAVAKVSEALLGPGGDGRPHSVLMLMDEAFRAQRRLLESHHPEHDHADLGWP